MARHLLAGLKGRTRHRAHGLAVAFQALSDALLVSAQHRVLTRTAALLEPAVQRLEVPEARQRHHEVAPRPAHQALHRPLVVALARTSVPVTDQVVRQKAAEQPRSAARPIGQNPRHQARSLS